MRREKKTRKRRSQSAIEFISTYAFVFLIISIVVVLLFAFSSVPSKSLPSQCTTYGGFSCIDAAYTIVGSNSLLVVTLTDTQPGVVSISSFNAKVNGLSAVGACTPSAPLPGTTIECTATFPFVVTAGNRYTSTFNITANYCANGAYNISNTTCKSGNSAAYTGVLTAQAQVLSPTTISEIYCIGGINSGGSDISNVYYAPISSTGVGAWTSTTNYPVPVDDHFCISYNNIIYCVAGSQGPYVYYGQLSSTGIGGWISTLSYPQTATDHICLVSNGYIYCVAGYQGSNNNNVYYSSISSTGVGTWTSSTNYPISTADHSCTAYGGVIYCVGGQNGCVLNNVYYAPVSNTGVGSWTAGTNYPTLVDYHTCIAYQGYIYCVGGYSCQTGNLGNVYEAPISSTGVGTWTWATGYPMPIYSQSCVSHGGYIYCVGGVSGSTLNSVYYAPISSTGGIGTWSSTTSYPIPVNEHECVTTTP
jgi:hypothetical protein